MLKELLCLGALILLGGASAGSVSAQEKTSAVVDMRWAVKIPMRDGVSLNATVFEPHERKEALPVIFTFTPYIGDSYTDRAMYFAGHGYVYALVDVRGRGNSGGDFEPFVNEGRDGSDVVEWFAKQPYCNGKVTMWGGSYAGFDQWTVLKEFPPHLMTIVPAAAAHPGVDFPFQHNLFGPYIEQWLTFTSGATSNGALFGNRAFWASKEREMYKQHRAFKDYDELAGNPSKNFQKWVEHPEPDAYYDAMAPTVENYRKISIPILTITGHFDGDQLGAFEYYKRHMAQGSAESKASHYLIIGPWDHAATRTPRAEIAGLKFAPASVVDLNQLHKEWYDWTMKGGAKPEFLKKRVAYYEMGAEEWKYADSLEAIAKGKLSLFLGSNGAAGDILHSGELKETRPAGAPSDQWTYDPLDTRPGEAEPDEDPAGLTSQRGATELYGQGVVYHSQPFPETREVTGFPKLTLWLSMDVPDTDLEADLYEIQSDGSSIALSGASMRARYRNSLRQASPVPAGKVEKYTFTNFTFFSRRVGKGSRLRLVVHSINSIQVEKNYNSGGVVAAETAKDARTAHITLFHDADRPSQLELPIVE
jgi:putative CocE/NonD family hydrolase